MSREFQSLQAFAQHLRTLRPAVEHAQRGVLQTYSYKIKMDAKNSLGHYQPGWPILAESTVIDRVRQGFSPDEPLRRTDKLDESIHYRTTVDHGFIGSDLDYAAAQERGSSPRLPARPYLAPAAFRHSKPFAEAMGRAVTRALEGDAYSVSLEPDAPAEG